MDKFYQLSKEETRKKVNGQQEPLTDQQVREHQEKYGKNELVEGKKKSTFQIFLEQYKDFLVIILIAAAIVSGCRECDRYFSRNHDECDSRNCADGQGRTVIKQFKEIIRSDSEGTS